MRFAGFEEANGEAGGESVGREGGERVVADYGLLDLLIAELGVEVMHHKLLGGGIVVTLPYKVRRHVK